MNKRTMNAAIAVLLIAFFSIVTACDTAADKRPYLVINVNLSLPVSPANKLFVIFYANPLWSNPWLILSSSTHTIVTPRLNIGNLPFSFEVIYDDNGDGQPSSGDLYRGWQGTTDRGAPLDTILLPTTDLMILNMDLDTNAALP